MTRYISDLIDLPERVYQGDFVLRLTEGVQQPDETVRTYVVTPQLADAFDNALGFVKSALQPPTSKAAYLHGSFGSGKSHFMAVLHLLLTGNARARAISELADVVAKHNTWTEGRRFLMVPYHMIGAHSMESAILGRYAEHIRTLHPEAPLPGIYLAERIFADAAQLRDRMGDAAFFDTLNAGAEGGGWGNIGSAWDASAFDRAIGALPGSEDRTRLVGALVDRLFRAYAGVASASDEAYVPLDEGLSTISKHARSLGYDAVILFLDELILWLASHAADLRFVNREGQKLAKLVEAQTADRPIPLVSFVARQRDLRELVGDHVPGAQQLAFGDVLKWWDARFHIIRLEDRNLPVIAEKRVLKPKSAAAKQELDEAFRETAKVREEVMDTLLTSTANREMFRQVYPFSPALVQALVGVSSLLQRERTALKVMQQLLVEQRDTLKVGDIVPVGDLFDAIVQGEEAVHESMRLNFDNAKRLYHRKLLPMLEREHNLTVEELKQLPQADGRAAAFRANDRLIKTLLLSALVPEVEALKALTPARLAALNHGTIRTPIPGRESQEVSSRLRRWAAQVGEIKLSEDANPTVSVQLTGVDTESIIEQARNIDNAGNRQRKIRELLFNELGLEDTDELFPVHEFTWRHTERSCELRYANVRELTDEALQPSDEATWRVVIDYPFDVEGHTPRSDLARLEQFTSTNQGCRTLVWIPAFLSRDSLKDLGTLVILDHVLAGERFPGFATHLQPADRAQAKSLLENQQSQLKQKLRMTLEGAYGVATPQPGSIDLSHDLSEHFNSLDGWQPQPPVGSSLGGAFTHLLGQALEQQFPAHPEFETPIRPAALRKVWDVVRGALDEPNRRVAVERTIRPIVRGIAQPLRLGEMGETHFVLGDSWTQHFLRHHAAEGGGAMTVKRLRSFIDKPQPMGLPELIQNLLILAFAHQTGRTLVLHGGPYEATIESLSDEVELRQQALPAVEVWDRARQRAASLFGYTGSALLSAPNVNTLESEARRLAIGKKAACRELVTLLAEPSRSFDVDAVSSHRGRTAAAAAQLVESLASAPPDRIVPLLADAEMVTSEPALGASIAKAAALVETLRMADWRLFEAVGRLSDSRAVAASGIRQRVSTALAADEYVSALGPELRAAQGNAVELLADIPMPPVPAPPQPGVTRVASAPRATMAAGEATALLDRLKALLHENERRRLTMEWQVDEEREV